MGGFAMRPYVENDKIKIAWIRADQFYPLRSNTNNIPECAIASKTVRTEGKSTVYYTLLEFHQWQKSNDVNEPDRYLITNELYRSEDDNVVGTRVPLNTIYEDLQEQVTLSNLKAPIFSYFRTPSANNITLESPLGIGIVDNAKSALDDINLANDTLFREVLWGKRRTIVPAEWLHVEGTNQNPNNPRPFFDTDGETLVGLNMDNVDNYKLVNNTVDIRIEQLKETIDLAIKKFETQIGMSSGSFSYDSGAGLKTATEVVSENSMTYQTRSSYPTMVEKAIKDLVVAIIEVGEAPQLFSDSKPRIDFDLFTELLNMTMTTDDGVFVNKDTQQDEDLKAFMANALPLKQFLIRNYGVNESDAEAWAKEVQNPLPNTLSGTALEDLSS